jgi:hypothetical protein
MSWKTKTALAAALLLTAADLAACGKVGRLERPGPLFGAGRNTTHAGDKAQRNVQDPDHPVDTVDPRDRTTEPAPPRTLPIQGASQGPSQTRPPGAIPDPYANPR